MESNQVSVLAKAFIKVAKFCADLSELSATGDEALNMDSRKWSVREIERERERENEMAAC